MSFLFAAIALVLGFAIGFFVLRVLLQRGLQSARQQAQRITGEASEKAKALTLQAREEALKAKADAEGESRGRRADLLRLERRLQQKEANLDRKTDSFEHREGALSQKEKDAEALRSEAEKMVARQQKQLELISAMSTDEAKRYLLERVESELNQETARLIRDWEVRFKQEAVERGKDILVSSIQRCVQEVTAETTVSIIPLPGDEMKGRLIGREGRNIRALEQATGVDLIVDDTPEVVSISSYDAVRREIAKIALNRLIRDGRIHPGRIEEVVAKAKLEVEATIEKEGQEAAFKSGVPGLHPELIKALGKLRFRTSYGQNVLSHSLETAQLGGMLAAELGADVAAAKKAGLLHDIGKGAGPEAEGGHAEIGAQMVKQWEKNPDIARAIGEHHSEVPSTIVLSFIVATADAISGSRPGARREAVEEYLKRVQTLESIACSLPGVEKAFAIQAGREVRIMVKPEEIDDMAAFRLARGVAEKIEENMQYPGQIRVTVIRETRAVDYAK